MVDAAGAPSSDADALSEALELIDAAQVEGIPLRMIGGLAVRVLCPSFPPRVRDRQDLDLASVSSARLQLSRFLIERNYQPDKRFNALYGHKQLFFSSPSGRAVDVLIDRVEMCHVLEFRERIERMPATLDVADLLMTKLQIVELNEKDVRDVLYLLSAFEVREGDEPGTVGVSRLQQIVADDWGWWRTVTGNLERIRHLITESGHVVPADPPYDPVIQLHALARAAHEVPKTLRWKIRAKVGERRRWYRVPDEDSHD
jgi:hypothetical protein